MTIVTCVLHRIWLDRDQGKLGPSAPLQVSPLYDGHDDGHDDDHDDDHDNDDDDALSAPLQVSPSYDGHDDAHDWQWIQIEYGDID